jgi:hypothetical protein
MLPWQIYSGIYDHFYLLHRFVYSKLTKTAINTYSTPLDSANRALSNHICFIQMRSAVKNATRTYQVIPR